MVKLKTTGKKTIENNLRVRIKNILKTKRTTNEYKIC